MAAGPFLAQGSLKDIFALIHSSQFTKLWQRVLLGQLFSQRQFLVERFLLGQLFSQRQFLLEGRVVPHKTGDV